MKECLPDTGLGEGRERGWLTGSGFHWTGRMASNFGPHGRVYWLLLPVAKSPAKAVYGRAHDSRVQSVNLVQRHGGKNLRKLVTLPPL